MFKSSKNERPILFSASMVRALLDDSKTQTRRICKQQPYPNGYKWDGNDFLCHNDYLPPSAMLMDGRGRSPYTTSDVEGWESECPFGLVGDQLWVRETHRPIFGQTCGLIAVDYKVDPREKWERLGDTPDCMVKGTKWTPSIHMRREYSRIQLEITGVRAERLNDISNGDAVAEGIGTPLDIRYAAIDCFKPLWESINGAGSWEANPYVWVIEFRRIK